MWPFCYRYPVLSVDQIVGREYDYIIVGGGTAGCAIASRLSENSGTRTLLLEKGGTNNHWYTRIPLTSVARGNYLVQMDTTSSGSRKGRVLTAETLGGCSRINGMIYMRGLRSYHDRLEKMGHPEWSWAKVLPYFQRLERGAQNSSTAALGIQTRRHEPTSGMYDYLEKSIRELGIPLNLDSGEEHGTGGYHHLDLTIDPQGFRHSAERAYLPHELVSQRRDSLHICVGALVSRLDILAGNDTVSGVFLIAQSDQEVLVKARREVIISAGALSTPKILQLSGIGPRELLERHAIPVYHEIPGVGKHLSDHSGIPVFIEIPSHDTMYQVAGSYFHAASHFFKFLAFGSGWFKSCVDRAIYLDTAHVDLSVMEGFQQPKGSATRKDVSVTSKRDGDAPDIEIMIIPMNTEDELYPDISAVTLQTCLNMPRSTGAVDIVSRNPKEHPRIHFDRMADSEDRIVARKGLRFALRLAQHFIQHSGYPYSARIFHGPGRSWDMLNDQELDDYIDSNITSVYHLTSTCKMGRREAGGVVDDNLRVYGYKNLRIADASILPTVTPVHPMSTVYMVAERCADLVKDTWCRA
ncbi:hypothetical protein F5Y10DRAFT_244175 [Nemania abortiva]|nr:hypothetical protein F5Y10DRAFT_244175 [Nemania abortiva]